MYVTIFAAGWASIVLSATTCGIELGAFAAFSPEYGIPLRIASCNGITHVFFGMSEEIVTVLVVALYRSCETRYCPNYERQKATENAHADADNNNHG
jgi:ABC-type Co2+ transport system permease subunit